jgi:hypothetical protein
VILKNRNHYRLVHETRETPTKEEVERAIYLVEELKYLGVVSTEAKKSWYKFQKEEIFVRQNKKSVLLSRLSSIVKGLKTVNQRRLYVPEESRAAADARLA